MYAQISMWKNKYGNTVRLDGVESPLSTFSPA
jgi:hypothetical protein